MNDEANAKIVPVKKIASVKRHSLEIHCLSRATKCLSIGNRQSQIANLSAERRLLIIFYRNRIVPIWIHKHKEVSGKMKRSKHTAGEIRRRCAARSMRRALKEKQKKRPLAGFLIAGASLAALFGIALIKAQADAGETTEDQD